MSFFKKEFKVAEEFNKERLDKFLTKHLPQFSRSKINNLINHGNVLVEGEVRKPSYKLNSNEKVTFEAKEEKKKLKPFDFEVKIVYEDNDIIVVDKPTGLVTHPPQKNYHKTLVNVLIYLKKDLASTGFLRPGVVHRLDKETSGLIVLAKNLKSYESLVSQFKNRKVDKRYQAIVWGEVLKKNITVDLPLGRDSKNRLKMKVTMLGVKKAQTQIEVVRVLEKATQLLIKPITGRMHQIRVHLKFLNFPIVGDKKYGIKDSYKDLLLHSYELKFKHPSNQKTMSFKSSLPERFKKFIEEHEKENI